MKDYDEFWKEIKGSHARHPSVRFRSHLVVNAVKAISDVAEGNAILDVGCGDGDLLKQLNDSLCLGQRKVNLIGYDISEYQIEKNRLHSGPPFDFRVVDFNKKIEGVDKFHIIICSELIEHLENWKIALENIAGMNRKGGYLILTTQAGKRYGSDCALGHLQHFELSYLTSYLEGLNYHILRKERRGFPFYNLQKIFNSIFLPASKRIANKKTNILASLLFNITYFLFRISIKSKYLGPQIFIMAQKAH